MSLIDRMRKARESVVVIGDHRLTISRPTHLDAMGMQYESNREAITGISKFVVGWDVTELQLVPGGTNELVPFDNELFIEWLQDQPKLWEPLIDAVKGAYQVHADKLKADEGNS